MDQDLITEREFELVNMIGNGLASNQRDLSKKMDLSLGLVNMLIKRLISKGVIRIKQLNKRKVEYILTPKGFTEKMRKSVKYTLKTINSINTINARLREIIDQLQLSQYPSVGIVGKSDFALLVGSAIKESYGEDFAYTHLDRLPDDKSEGYLLICKEIDTDEKHANEENSINIVEELAKDYSNLIAS